MNLCGYTIIIFLVCLRITQGRRYYRESGPVGLKGEHDPQKKGPVVNDCPLQCRCIALSHLGYRGMAERWNSMGQMHGSSKTVFKGTESPVWQEEPEKLQGRDVVCMGLNKVPRPLPSSVTKLTLFGDSSDKADTYAHAQISSIRHNSFVNGEDLIQLTINGNNLQILYPYIFKGLPNLQNIALQNNNIRHISAATFAKLGKLVELRLSDNMIRFLSPNVFSQLLNLEYLYLNGNKLAVLNQHMLRKLKNLQHLDISRNNFRSFSDSVFDGAVNLQELLINENQITYVRAQWFQNLSKLRNLEIRANVITRIDPSSFKTLSSLEQLSLSANIINTVSNEAFRNLSKLQVLDIGTNDINNLEPDCFSGLDSLRELDLSVNRISFINNRTFTATKTLRTLDLSKNVIKDIEEAALHPLESLRSLYLSNNKLKRVESKTFSGLLELKEVNLENNIISEVENDAFIVAPLNQLSKITWLSLQFNHIKSLNAYSLFGLPHLKFLNIGHNRIKTIHQKSFYTLSSLQNLLLNDNKLSEIEDGTFSNLKLLYSLSLEKNKLSKVSDNTFIGLKHLDDLNIVSNALDTISANAFRHFTKLKRLDLNSNLLSKFVFPDLILVKDLNYVDLSNNRLYSVKFPDQRTHEIRQLILSQNQLQTLSSEIINVLSPAGITWLRDNPWSCDCRLEWLAKFASEYRIRLLGSRDTVCKSPSALYGKKVTNVGVNDFRCDNTTVSKTIVCQNLQIKYSAQSSETLRKGKQESRKWHVTFRKENDTSHACNGLLLNDKWALTRSTCAKTYISANNSNIVVKVGRRESREIALTIDYKTDAVAADFDLRLVRLVPKNSKSRKARSKSNTIPCILTHAQYHQLSRAVPEGVFTSRSYKEETEKWRLSARRGKIVQTCDNIGDICLRVKETMEGANLQGSPLSLRYQGVWYLAGLGVTGNSTGDDVQRFTPLWSVTNWMATTMHEVDSKCKFQKNKGKASVLCEGLSVDGVTKSNSDQFLSV